jgi:hypothetical protein
MERLTAQPEDRMIRRSISSALDRLVTSSTS